MPLQTLLREGRKPKLERGGVVGGTYPLLLAFNFRVSKLHHVSMVMPGGAGRHTLSCSEIRWPEQAMARLGLELFSLSHRPTTTVIRARLA